MFHYFPKDGYASSRLPNEYFPNLSSGRLAGVALALDVVRAGFCVGIPTGIAQKFLHVNNESMQSRGVCHAERRSGQFSLSGWKSG